MGTIAIGGTTTMSLFFSDEVLGTHHGYSCRQ